MKKQNSFLFDVANYEFIITPQRLNFTHPMAGVFLLELQKGCQSIKVLPEIAEFQNNKSYVYQKTQPILIKAFKEKCMGFSWSLYKKIENKLEYVDSFKLDLKVFFNAYLQDLKRLTSQLTQFTRNFQNGSSFSQNWKRIKSQLRSINTKETSRNPSKSIIFEYIIEIKCKIDYLLEQDMNKKRVLTKDSISSHCSSSLSLNSLTQVNNMTRQPKNPLKSKSSINGQNTYSKSTPFIQNERIKLPKNLKPSQQQGIMIMPQLKQKQLLALSDIIEVSNQQSILNTSNTGEGTDRKPSEQGLTSEDPFRSFKKTNTFHFRHNPLERNEFRRNNSLKAMKIGSKIDDQQNGDIQQQPVEQQQLKSDNAVLTNSNTIITMHSQTTKISFRLKDFMIILLIFGIFICLGVTLSPLILGQLRKNPNLFKNKGKIKKNTLN